MTFKLFQQVALAQDMPEKGLKRGDVATVVEYHPGRDGEDGYSLEVFNAVGDTIAVITLPESAIEPLLADEILRAFACHVIWRWEDGIRSNLGLEN